MTEKNILEALGQVVELKQRGTLDEAEKILAQLIAAAPNDLRVRREQVDYHILNSSPERAIAELLAHPRAQEAAFQILFARAYRHNQNDAAAAEILAQVLSQDPANIEARYEFGRTQISQLPMRMASSFKKISVLVPCRFTRNPDSGKFWLEHAVETIRQQTIAKQIPIEICIGIDPDAKIPENFQNQSDLIFVHLHPQEPKGMPAALNRAAAAATGDVIAFLEDDDSWHPNRLAEALKLLEKFDFVSSTIKSCLPKENLFGFHDYATPTTWVMRRATWDLIGPFNPEFPWHADAEWLGRLNQSNALRCHQAEATLPEEWSRLIILRPFMFFYHAVSKIGSAVHFTQWPDALCNKIVHTNTLTRQIDTDPAIKSASLDEYERLNIAFGSRPF